MNLCTLVILFYVARFQGFFYSSKVSPCTVIRLATVNLAYNVPVGTSVFCPLYTKSVLRVYRTLSVIPIYRTLSVIDINRTLSGICIPYTVRYTRKCDTVRCTTACLHHVPSWLLCIQIIHCYMYFTL